MCSPMVRPLPPPRMALTRRGIPPLSGATLTSLPSIPRCAEAPLLWPPPLLALHPLLLSTGTAPGDSPPSGPSPTHPSPEGLASSPPPMVPMLGPILALGPILLPPLPLPSPPALRPHPPMVVDPSIPRRARPSAQGTSCLLRPLGPLLAFVPPLGPLWPIWPSRPSPSRPPFFWSFPP